MRNYTCSFHLSLHPPPLFPHARTQTYVYRPAHVHSSEDEYTHEGASEHLQSQQCAERVGGTPQLIFPASLSLGSAWQEVHSSDSALVQNAAHSLRLRGGGRGASKQQAKRSKQRASNSEEQEEDEDGEDEEIRSESGEDDEHDSASEEAPRKRKGGMVQTSSKPQLRVCQGESSNSRIP